jgi:hypothetical protein
MKINSVLLPIYAVAMAAKHCTNTVGEILYAIETSFSVIPNNEPNNYKHYGILYEKLSGPHLVKIVSQHLIEPTGPLSHP